MIQINPINTLPPLDWSELAQLEMQEQGFDWLEKTDAMWQIGTVAVCGFVWHTFFQPPWMWFALRNRVTLRELIDFRRLSSRIPRGTRTAVRQGHEVAKRFAEFYGFAATGEQYVTAQAVYDIFRKES